MSTASCKSLADRHVALLHRRQRRGRQAAARAFGLRHLDHRQVIFALCRAGETRLFLVVKLDGS